MKTSAWRVWGLLAALVAAGDACVTPMEDAVAAEIGESDDAELAPGFVESAVYTEGQWQTVAGMALPQSAHPYRNNLAEAVVVDAPGCAQATRLRFSRVELRSGDSLSLYSVDGRRVQRLTGSRTNFVSNAVTGTQVRLVLRSNGSGTAFGYQVAAVQVVEGPIPCPRMPWLMCTPDQVTMAPDVQPVCTCPRPPRCEPLAGFSATFGAGGGFTGGWSGRLIDGEGKLWRVRRLTAGSTEERTLVAFASLERTRVLAETLQGLDFFRRQNGHGAAHMTATFAAIQGALHADASWPSGTVPADMEPATSAFTKASSCGTGADAARCAAGFACHDGECVEAPACSCPATRAPVCSVFHMTWDNACIAACAGEDVAHAGACGVDGEPCGDTAALACADAFTCTFGPAETPRTQPEYAGEPGTCRPGTPTCACAEIYAPVCGGDGRTYSNACDAGCHGVVVDHAGPCGNAGDPCAPANGWTCAAGLLCGADNTCATEPACVCRMVSSPVCGINGVTFPSPCDATCASVAVRHDGACGVEGDTCGTIRGLACQDGFNCRYAESTWAPPFPDAGGSCVPTSWCDAPTDGCGATVRLSCPATWFCENHACRFECNAPVERWEAEEAVFETAHPYANNLRKGWTATGEADTRAVRFVFERFETERNYDVVTLHDEGWNEVARYTGTLGAFTTVEVPGRVAHLVFASDRSVTAWGFRGVRVEYRRP